MIAKTMLKLVELTGLEKPIILWNWKIPLRNTWIAIMKTHVVDSCHQIYKYFNTSEMSS